MTEYQPRREVFVLTRAQQDELHELHHRRDYNVGVSETLGIDPNRPISMDSYEVTRRVWLVNRYNRSIRGLIP